MKKFSWQEYYLLARKLLSQADDSPHKEAMLRSAVSRAYYAAYHRACDYLKGMNEYPTKQEFAAHRRESHKFVIDKFIDNTVHPEWNEIGQKLLSLKNFRYMADYVISVEKHAFRKKPYIESKIDQAEEIIKLIDSL